MSLILLIEDEPTQRLTARLALIKAGHDVLEAADGERGLDLVHARRPDLIVCDVGLPGLNGIEVVAALRGNANTVDIPIVIMTAMADRAHMRVAMTSGADDFIAKPFSPSELRDAVSTVLAKREALRGQMANSMKAEIETTLERQKEALAVKYETRLMRELNFRWAVSDGRNTDHLFDNATLLVLDLVECAHAQRKADEEVGKAMRRVYQTASDATYLFRAQYLQPYGPHVVAIFADPPGTVGVGAQARAARAAFALVKTLGEAADAGRPDRSTPSPASPGIAVALHTGQFTLLHVNDPLHGGPGSTLVCSETLAEAIAVLDYARSANWRIACSSATAQSIRPFTVIGQNAHVPLAYQKGWTDAVELLELEWPAMDPELRAT